MKKLVKKDRESPAKIIHRIRSNGALDIHNDAGVLLNLAATGYNTGYRLYYGSFNFNSVFLKRNGRIMLYFTSNKRFSVTHEKNKAN